MGTSNAWNALGALALTTMIIGAPGALAQRPGGNLPGGGPDGDPGRRGFGDPAQMFERADVNKDGKITADEFRGPEELFTQLDKDKDGSLTPEEAGGLRDIIAQRFNPIDRLKTDLGATDEEWQVLQPRIQAVMELRAKTMPPTGPGMGFLGGRGPEGPGRPGEMRGPARREGPDGMRPERGREDRPRLGLGGGVLQPMPEAIALQKAIDDKSTSDENLEKALKAYRNAQKTNEAELAKARNELRDIVTVRQEAVLVARGILD